MARAVPLVLHLAAATSGGQDVQVRKVVAGKWGKDVSVFSFNMGGPGARWCGNIGRCHKGNFTYWVGDVLRGRVWQKCFDKVDC